MSIDTIEDAVSAIRCGELVIVVDDEDRENEGDLVIATDAVSTASIAFMMNYARGLICVAMEGSRLDELEVPLMVPRNTELMNTAFTVSVDYIPGTTTGISASDRATTLRALVMPSTRANDFARPGHVFPLRTRPEFSVGRVIRKPPLISPVSPAGHRPASSARSPTTMDRWRVCPTLNVSPNVID